LGTPSLVLRAFENLWTNPKKKMRNAIFASFIPKISKKYKSDRGLHVELETENRFWKSRTVVPQKNKTCKFSPSEAVISKK
jgi:hypothetical protein